MSLAAAELALDDAGLDPADARPVRDVRWSLPAGSGGNEFGQRELQKLWAQGPRHVGAYQSIAWFYAASTGQISIRHGLQGPVRGAWSAEGAGGLDALGAGAPARCGAARRRSSPAAPRRRSCPYALACQLDQRPADAPSRDPRARLPAVRRRRLRLRARRGRRDARRRGRRRRRASAARRGSTARSPATPPPTTPATARPPPDATQLRPRDARSRWPTPGVTPDEVDVVFADGAGAPDARPARGAARSPRRSASARRRAGHRAEDDDRAAATPGGVGAGRRRRAAGMRDGVHPADASTSSGPPDHGLGLVRDESRAGAGRAPRSCSPAATAASTARSCCAATPDPAIHHPQGAPMSSRSSPTPTSGRSCRPRSASPRPTSRTSRTTRSPTSAWTRSRSSRSSSRSSSVRLHDPRRGRRRD